MVLLMCPVQSKVQKLPLAMYTERGGTADSRFSLAFRIRLRNDSYLVNKHCGKRIVGWNFI
jgi:hypothetical protein